MTTTRIRRAPAAIAALALAAVVVACASTDSGTSTPPAAESAAPGASAVAGRRCQLSDGSGPSRCPPARRAR